MLYFFFSSRRRHTRSKRDWSSDVCSSDLFFPFITENRNFPNTPVIECYANGGMPYTRSGQPHANRGMPYTPFHFPLPVSGISKIPYTHNTFRIPVSRKAANTLHSSESAARKKA